MQPLDINGLRQAMMAQAMQRQGQPMSPQGGMRTMPNQALRGGMPNTPGTPQPGMPQPAQPNPVGMGQAGGANPTQQMSKVAQQSQSPMMDDDTRAKAKALATKLLQYM